MTLIHLKINWKIKIETEFRRVLKNQIIFQFVYSKILCSVCSANRNIGELVVSGAVVHGVYLALFSIDLIYMRAILT